ncbi:Zinc finger protein AEBP2 [Chelonia mydas]|uniref:Zinc finger protein AEBP2 n=1 Tax=Chelonia mydas TaxID=8469 RepID=M7AYY0_CHEMY|nr:Zinc finger protein AEBP2 [Chelonia mydas]
MHQGITFSFFLYSISSTIMDVDSTISSGRSTPVMMNGQGVTASSAKSIAYNCCWDQCHACFNSSPDLADHIRSIHVDGQRGGCVVGGCNASFASQGGLARHVPTHFSQQNSSKVASQPKAKEESPSKAGMNKRRKLKNKRRRSLHDLTPSVDAAGGRKNSFIELSAAASFPASKEKPLFIAVESVYATVLVWHSCSGVVMLL